MERKDGLSNDYFKLFVRREGKVVLGKNLFNLWLLTAVLTLTFFAIAFSNASMEYLSVKMNDPFINWVDIQNDYGEGDIAGLMDGLSDTTVQREYHFVNYQMDYSNHYMFFGKSASQIQYLGCRFFQSFNDNPLLNAILSDDNVVGKCAVSPDSLDDETMGVIVAEDVIRKLGYDSAPSFIDLCRYSAGADTLGFPLYQGFAHLPVPVIGVVKRLPGNMDIISTKFFYSQQRNDMTYPFNLNNRDYAASLYYFVPDGEVADFKKSLSDATADSCYVVEMSFPFMKTFRRGLFITASSASGEFTPETAGEVDAKMMAQFRDKDVHRVYDYAFSDYSLPQGSYISVQFKDLGRIRDFEAFVKDKYKVKIEMSQINAKENFNAVSVMANILSWAIIIFSILCIVLFVVNLLQSYFQKVKRNLGTFKAFGMRDSELIRIYTLIVFMTIAGAVVISMAFTALAQIALLLLGVVKDGGYGYLSLWNAKTVWSIVIIALSSVATVYFVMKKQLSATPGDLIYDR